MSSMMGSPRGTPAARGEGEAAEHPEPGTSAGLRPAERAWTLPVSLTIGDTGFDIETDWRTVLYVLGILQDPEYEPDERAAICLRVLIPGWERIPPERYEEAMAALMGFIDGGVPAGSGRQRPRTMDWEQDGPLLIPAVNRVLGQEIRALPYLHWWTFVGAYMEIGECLFSTVLRLRRKRADGKKLEKDEQEFIRDNKHLMTLRPRETEAERARREELRRLFV